MRCSPAGVKRSRRRDPPDLEDGLNGVSDHDTPDASADDEHQARRRRGHQHQDPIQARTNHRRPRQQTNTQAWRRRWAAEDRAPGRRWAPPPRIGSRGHACRPAHEPTPPRHPPRTTNDRDARRSARGRSCPSETAAADGTSPPGTSSPRRHRNPTPVLGSKRPSGATRHSGASARAIGEFTLLARPCTTTPQSAIGASS
jgi:hypothetical protein